MKIRIAIVSHASRRDMAWNLAESIGAESMHEDSTGIGCTMNHARAWQAHAEHTAEADWFVVLEDDALPIAGFRSQLGAALTVAPAPIVSLYLGTGYPENMQQRIRVSLERARAVGAHWLMGGALAHAVAVAIPADHVAEVAHVLQVSDGIPPDAAVSMWARHRGHRVAYSVPSLVDHADIAPVIPPGPGRYTRDQPRRAHWIGRRATWAPYTAAII